MPSELISMLAVAADSLILSVIPVFDFFHGFGPSLGDAIRVLFIVSPFFPLYFPFLPFLLRCSTSNYIATSDTSKLSYSYSCLQPQVGVGWIIFPEDCMWRRLRFWSMRERPRCCPASCLSVAHLSFPFFYLYILVAGMSVSETARSPL
jgi:hypothetical protein